MFGPLKTKPPNLKTTNISGYTVCAMCSLVVKLLQAESAYSVGQSMITARAELLKDIKNHGMARLRACESHNLAASALIVFFFVCAWHFVPVRHASQCSVVGLTQK